MQSMSISAATHTINQFNANFLKKAQLNMSKDFPKAFLVLLLSATTKQLSAS